jgi:hypothetical protein
MTVVVILHVIHNFTENFILLWCFWREFLKQCLIIDNIIQHHWHCSSCKRTSNSAIITSTFCYRHLTQGIHINQY